MIIYLPFNDYGLSWINSWHSMLALPNMSTVFIYNEPQEYITNKYFNIFGNLQQSVNSV